MENTPYLYYNNKLGFKISYLTSDRRHDDSLMLISYNALYKRMKSNTCCEKELRRGSLGIDALILFSSLSRQWKDAITSKFGSPKEEIKQSWFAQHYEFDRKAKEFYLAHRYGDKNEKKIDLALVEKFSYNASMLNTVIKMKTNRKAYAKALGVTSLDIWQSLSNDVNAFREIPHTLPPNKDSLRRKVTKYQKENYASLLGRLANNNAKKVISNEQTALLDELIKFHNNLDNVQIAKFYNTTARVVGWKEITDGTVANRKKKKHISVHAGRKGVKSLKNKVLMQVKRAKPSTSMLYWTMDGWDVELLYQETVTKMVKGKMRTVTTYHNRPTIVVIIDPFNYYPIGYAIGTHETPELIKEALKNAFYHVKELFGDYYMPYQLQSDNYAKKKLKPIYEAISKHYTPAEVGNAKSKVIEPYFNRINNKYFKLLNNWSGYGTVSGSKNQPNSEYLSKTKKNFPTKLECFKQIDTIINQERIAKIDEFKKGWKNTKEEHKQIMSFENFLLTLGSETGYTNSLKGDGLTITIHGQKYTYDSFDINFRHQASLNWIIKYDDNDLDQVLAISSCGSERFILQQPYIQPMALADRKDEDIKNWQKIKEFNKSTVSTILDEQIDNYKALDPFLAQDKLENTMAKLLLTDSLGQHKNNKSQARLEANKATAKLKEKTLVKEQKQETKTFAQEQEEYYKSQINVSEYL